MMYNRLSELPLANISRRGFLAGVGAGSLILAVGLPSAIEAQEKKFGADGMPNGWRDDPKVFVAIAEDGTVTVTCHRQEMGQGVRTSIAMVVPTNSRPIGRGFASPRVGATKGASATRTRMVRAACVTGSCRCAGPERRRGRCWNRPRLRSGASP